jgi:predicted alpha/beta-hydrolase family hydrolase
VAAIAALRDGPLGEVDLIVGGRSSGARVACRTAGEVGAHAVLCLAFPLQPPQHRRDGSQAPSRLDELESVSVPVLVVQGDNDPFGMPPEGPNRRVIALQGDHSLRSDPAGLERAVGDWLGALGLPAA